MLEYQELVRESSSGLAQRARPTVDSRPLLHFPSQPWPGLETEVDQDGLQPERTAEKMGPAPTFQVAAPPLPTRCQKGPVDQDLW